MSRMSVESRECRVAKSCGVLGSARGLFQVDVVGGNVGRTLWERSNVLRSEGLGYILSLGRGLDVCGCWESNSTGVGNDSSTSVGNDSGTSVGNDSGTSVGNDSGSSVGDDGYIVGDDVGESYVARDDIAVSDDSGSLGDGGTSSVGHDTWVLANQSGGEDSLVGWDDSLGVSQGKDTCVGSSQKTQCQNDLHVGGRG